MGYKRSRTFAGLKVCASRFFHTFVAVGLEFLHSRRRSFAGPSPALPPGLRTRFPPSSIVDG